MCHGKVRDPSEDRKKSEPMMRPKKKDDNTEDAEQSRQMNENGFK